MNVFEVDLKAPAGGFGRPRHVFALRERYRHRLFAENVQPATEGLQRGRIVLVVGVDD